MSSFTPGPWIVGDDDKHDQPQVVSLPGELIAVVAHECVKRPPELYANARLIAAAPDMYEALCAILSDTDDLDLDLLADISPATAKLINNAIAKAEGR